MEPAVRAQGRLDAASGPGPGGSVEDIASLVEHEVGTRGFIVIPDVLKAPECAALASAVDEALESERPWITDRPDEFGRVLSLVHYGEPFLELLGIERLIAPFDRTLGEDCILYTMTTGCLPPSGGPRPVHVDFDHRHGEELLYLAAMIMLDDFTVANGATRFLPDSIGSEPPDLQTFEERSVAVEGPAGSVCWFDPRLWHTSGTNTTPRWRRSILIGMVRRWMKPRFDHPAMLGFSADGLSARTRRVLGFDSRPPASYVDYYGRDATDAAPLDSIHPTRSPTR